MHAHLEKIEHRKGWEVGAGFVLLLVIIVVDLTLRRLLAEILDWSFASSVKGEWFIHHTRSQRVVPGEYLPFCGYYNVLIHCVYTDNLTIVYTLQYPQQGKPLASFATVGTAAR